MTMTDTVTNLSVDITSIKAVPSEGVTFDMSGYTVTYTIPDATKVVVTYRARVLFDKEPATHQTATIKFSNTAEMKGYHDHTEGDAEKTNSGGGVAPLYRINLMKYEAGNMTHRLQGAVFALCDVNDNPILDKDGNEVQFTTDDDGMIRIYGDQHEDGWALFPETEYHLKEIVAPPNYMLADFVYKFTISRDGRTDYQNLIFHSGDTMSAKNYPGTDINVKKSWKNKAGEEVDPPEDTTIEVKLQQKIGGGEFSDIIREEVKQPDGSYQWQDTEGKTLILSADNDWEGWFNSLPKTVPTGESFDGDDVGVEYQVVETKVNGETPKEGTVTIDAQESGGSTIVTITNIIEEGLGSLKLKKLVTVNGDVTTGTIADETYVFTITGPTEAEDAYKVTKNVEITVSDGAAVSAKVDGQDAELVDDYVEVANLEAGEYTITETTPTNGTSPVDGKTKTVTVEAGKSGEDVSVTAKATFTNNIDVVDIDVDKVWVNADGSDTWPEEVTVDIQLTADDEEVSGKTATLSADQPSYKFEKLPKYQSDGKTVIAYSIEEPTKIAGYTSSVVEKEARKFTVTNAYSATGTLNLEAEKKFKNGKLKEGEFTFELMDADEKVVQSKTNDAAGKVTFDEIEYKLSDVAKAPFTYTVREVPGNRTDVKYDATVYTVTVGLKDNGDGTLEVKGSENGITYDRKVYTVKVTVTDNGDGTMTAKADKAKSDIRFVNTYTEKKSKTSSSKGSKTGDEAPLGVLFGGLGLGAAGLAVLLWNRRKKNKSEE